MEHTLDQQCTNRSMKQNLEVIMKVQVVHSLGDESLSLSHPVQPDSYLQKSCMDPSESLSSSTKSMECVAQCTADVFFGTSYE